MAERQFDLKIRVKASDEASGVLGFVGNNLQRLGMVAIAGIGALTASAAIAGSQLISMASDAEEMGSKFNIVFGEFAPEARQELEAFGDEVGRNTFELVEWAGAFQDTFVPMGFARGEAADLSRQLVELTVDVASFNNALETDVARDFQSALVGNHETVRKYGIVITQVALDAELMRMGIEKGVEAATEQEKVMARLSLIMAGTSDAHGDAARTADSWANQMRALTATLNEAATGLGGKLLPAAKPLLGLVRELVDDALPPLLAFVDARVIPGITSFSTTLTILKESLDNGIDPMVAFGEAFERLTGIDLGPLGTLSMTINDILAKVGEAAAPFVDWIAQNISLSDVLIGLGVAIGSVVVPALLSVLSTIAPIIAIFAGVVLAVSLLRQAWENDFLGIRTMLTRVWDDGIKPAFQYMKDNLFPRVTAIVEYFGLVWETKLAPAFERAGLQLKGDFIPAIGDLLIGAVGGAVTVLEALLGVIEWLLPVFAKIAEAIGWVVDRFTEWRRITADLYRWLSSLVIPPWLTPGSPTPLELGVRGIVDAMDELAREQLPSLSRGFGIANPLSPALSGSGAAGGGSGEMVKIVVPVTLNGREVGYGAIEGTLEALRQRGKIVGGSTQR